MSARMARMAGKIEVLIKGGMPVLVSGYTFRDGEGYTSWNNVEVTGVYWASTGKPVTPTFEASIGPLDWERIVEAIANEG